MKSLINWTSIEILSEQQHVFFFFLPSTTFSSLGCYTAYRTIADSWFSNVLSVFFFHLTCCMGLCITIITFDPASAPLILLQHFYMHPFLLFPYRYYIFFPSCFSHKSTALTLIFPCLPSLAYLSIYQYLRNFYYKPSSQYATHSFRWAKCKE